METGIFCNFSAHTPPEMMAAQVRAIEARGFHCIWVPEHVVLFEEELGAVLLGVLVVPRCVASVDVLVRGPRPGARDQNRQSPRV